MLYVFILYLYQIYVIFNHFLQLTYVFLIIAFINNRSLVGVWLNFKNEGGEGGLIYIVMSAVTFTLFPLSPLYCILLYQQNRSHFIPTCFFYIWFGLSLSTSNFYTFCNICTLSFEDHVCTIIYLLLTTNLPAISIAAFSFTYSVHHLSSTQLSNHCHIYLL